MYIYDEYDKLALLEMIVYMIHINAFSISKDWTNNNPVLLP